MNFHQICMIAVMALTVIALRALPMLLFGRRRSPPALLAYLGKVLTAAAIAMLVVYSLYGEWRDGGPAAGRLWSVLIAAGVTVTLQKLFRNPLISILGGTACFMLLIQKILC